jgi:acetyl esterase/lipase
MTNLARLRSVGALAVLALAHAGLGAQQPSPIPPAIMLYPHGAPRALGNGEADKPRLYPFLPKAPTTRAAVLVLPGGGYTHIALGHEGIQAAEWLNAQGIAAFVLDYRVAPCRFPAPINDGVQAMRLIRAHAAEYNIDPDRIGVWGFSAGGHLAATLATQCKLGSGNPNVPAAPATTGPDKSIAGPPDSLRDLACQPNFVILAYQVISMEKAATHPGSRAALLGPNPDEALARQLSAQTAVTASTAPTFLFATTGDPVVPVENSVLFYQALKKAGVPAEMHLFDFADHGCGLCGTIPELAVWPALLRTWLVHRTLLPANAPPPPPPGPNMPDWPSGLDGPGHQ